MSLNQNVWPDHATMQQDILLHFWVIFSLSTPVDSSEATWKKATKCNKHNFFLAYKYCFNVDITASVESTTIVTLPPDILLSSLVQAWVATSF